MKAKHYQGLLRAAIVLAIKLNSIESAVEYLHDNNVKANRTKVNQLLAKADKKLLNV